MQSAEANCFFPQYCELHSTAVSKLPPSKTSPPIDSVASDGGTLLSLLVVSSWMVVFGHCWVLMVVWSGIYLTLLDSTSLYFTLLHSTTLYHDSTWLYYTLLYHDSTMTLLDSTWPYYTTLYHDLNLPCMALLHCLLQSILGSTSPSKTHSCHALYHTQCDLVSLPGWEQG